MKKLLAGLTMVLCFMAWTVQASTIIFEQPLSPSGGWLHTSTTNGWTAADDFKFDTDSIITEIQWWGKRIEGTENNFSFTFYENNSSGLGFDLPGSSVLLAESAGSLTATALPVGGYTFYTHILDTPFYASAHVTYWLSIFDNTNQGIFYWLSSQSSSGAPAAQTPNDLSAWGSIDYDWGPSLAFRLLGDTAAPVPEPATMLLFGTGLAGLAAARRRKKKAC